MLDAWENVNTHDIVNLLAAVCGQTIFPDSVDCEDECQDAAIQARMVQEKLLECSGTATFIAVVSDNASACIEGCRA